jgi:hypothetical protein
MLDPERPLNPSIFHRVFYGPSELRAGWPDYPVNDSRVDNDYRQCRMLRIAS